MRTENIEFVGSHCVKYFDRQYKMYSSDEESESYSDISSSDVEDSSVASEDTNVSEYSSSEAETSSEDEDEYKEEQAYANQPSATRSDIVRAVFEPPSIESNVELEGRRFLRKQETQYNNVPASNNTLAFGFQRYANVNDAFEKVTTEQNDKELVGYYVNDEGKPVAEMWESKLPPPNKKYDYVPGNQALVKTLGYDPHNVTHKKEVTGRINPKETVYGDSELSSQRIQESSEFVSRTTFFNKAHMQDFSDRDVSRENYEGYNERRGPGERIRNTIEHSWRHTLASPQNPSNPALESTYTSTLDTQPTPSTKRMETSDPYRWNPAPNRNIVQLNSVIDIPIVKNESKRDGVLSGRSDGMGAVTTTDVHSEISNPSQREIVRRKEEAKAPIVNFQSQLENSSVKSASTDQIPTERETKQEAEANRGPVAFSADAYKIIGEDQPDQQRETIASPTPIGVVEWQAMVKTLGSDHEGGDDQELIDIRNGDKLDVHVLNVHPEETRKKEEESIVNQSNYARALDLSESSLEKGMQGREFGEEMEQAAPTFKQLGERKTIDSLLEREGNDDQSIKYQHSPDLAGLKMTVQNVPLSSSDSKDDVHSARTNTDHMSGGNYQHSTVCVQGTDAKPTSAVIMDSGLNQTAPNSKLDISDADDRQIHSYHSKFATGAEQSQHKSEVYVARTGMENTRVNVAEVNFETSTAVYTAADHEKEEDRTFDTPKFPTGQHQGEFKSAFDIDRVPIHQEADWRFSNMSIAVESAQTKSEGDVVDSHRSVSIPGEMRTSSGILESQSKLNSGREPMRSVGGSVLGPDRLKQAHAINWQKNELRVGNAKEEVHRDRSTPTRFMMSDAPLNHRKMEESIKFPAGRETPTRVMLPTMPSKSPFSLPVENLP